jgi:exosortase family protein XrtF
LNNYFKQYRPFLIFLLKFFLSYLALTVVYKIYLSGFDASLHQVDSFTNAVARQTTNVIEWFGYTAFLEWHSNEASVKLIVNEKYVARVVEGCNVMSVMILFVTFIIAFSGRLKHTLVFGVMGCALLYVLNIFRIALLAIALYHFPERERLLHEIVFPVVIYGVVFLLWLVWVNKYSTYAAKNSTK